MLYSYAGNTNLPCDTRVKVVYSDDVDLINVTGRVTHPFPSLMWPRTKYTVGLRIDEEFHGLFSGDIANLTISDTFTPFFGEFDLETGFYYIENEKLLAEIIGESTLYEVATKYGGIHNDALNRLIFLSEEPCFKCIDEIEERFFGRSFFKYFVSKSKSRRD